MYQTEYLEETALKAIEDNKLMFFNEIIAFLPCSSSTFFEHFPSNSEQYKRLKEKIDKNKITVKASMRGKWYKSNAPALQLGLYKLIATDEERRALSMSTIDLEIPEETEIKVSIKRSKED